MISGPKRTCWDGTFGHWLLNSSSEVTRKVTNEMVLSGVFIGRRSVQRKESSKHPMQEPAEGAESLEVVVSCHRRRFIQS